MKLKQIVDEVFGDYKECGMLLIFPSCTWKCEGCQNKHLALLPTIDFPDDDILERYISNPFSRCIIFGGLEPLDSVCDIAKFIQYLMKIGANPLLVVYTGYELLEVNDILHTTSLWALFTKYSNVVLKYGRYEQDGEACFNKALGINLASNNQSTIDFRSDIL